MAEYALFIDKEVPEMYRELYEILLSAVEMDEFPFGQHSLAFRCRKCEDVVELRIKDINTIYFYSDFIRVNFDKSSIWISPYDRIEDIWIEKFVFLEDTQATLLDDY